MDALQRALQADGRAPLAQTALIEAQLAALSAKHEDVLAQAHPRHLPCLVVQSLMLSGPNTEDVLAQVRRPWLLHAQSQSLVLGGRLRRRCVRAPP